MYNISNNYEKTLKLVDTFEKCAKTYKEKYLMTCASKHYKSL